MRILLAIIIAADCAQSLIAGQLPLLTVKEEISLAAEKERRQANASPFFPETPSRCCYATVKSGIYLNCAKATPMPFYFFSIKPIPDVVVLDYERKLRPELSLGAQVVFWVNPDDT